MLLDLSITQRHDRKRLIRSQPAWLQEPYRRGERESRHMGDGQGLCALASSQLCVSSPAECPRSRADGGPGRAMTRSLRPDGLVRVAGNVSTFTALEILDARAYCRDESAIRPVRVRRSWHDDWLERPGEARRVIRSVTSPRESWRALELSVRIWPRSHLSVDLRELGWRTDCWLRSRKPSPSTRWPQCIPPGVGTVVGSRCLA